MKAQTSVEMPVGVLIEENMHVVVDRGISSGPERERRPARDESAAKIKILSVKRGPGGRSIVVNMEVDLDIDAIFGVGLSGSPNSIALKVGFSQRPEPIEH